jgi:hypothetical protein
MVTRTRGFLYLQDVSKAAKTDDNSGDAPHGAAAIDAIWQTLEHRPAI